MTLHTSDEIQTIHRRGILLAFAGCVVLSVAVLSVALWMMHKGIGKSEKLPVSGDELFDPQKIHKIHLIFTKETRWNRRDQVAVLADRAEVLPVAVPAAIAAVAPVEVRAAEVSVILIQMILALA